MKVAIPSWYQRGAYSRGLVMYPYRSDSGLSSTGRTLPKNRLRLVRSPPAAWSEATTWTSSWFMMAFMLSFTLMVSKSWANGASPSMTWFTGMAPPEALA